MRFVDTFAALALVGSLSSVSAGPCRPGSSSTLSAPTSSASATSTSAHGSGPIVNEIEGGDFRRRSNSPSGVSNFVVEGQGSHVQGGGYTGGGSNEKNCASLEAASTQSGPGKRAVGQYAAISQQLTNLQAGSAYTVQFFYAVQSSTQSGACRIEASFRSNVFTSTPYFSTSDTPSSWASSTISTSIRATQGQMSFALTCVGGGSAQVYIDSIFVSNQVIPGTIDDSDLVFDATSTKTSELPSATTTITEATTEATTVASSDSASSAETTAETITKEGNTSETDPASGTTSGTTSVEQSTSEESETGTEETTTVQETTLSTTTLETSTEMGATTSEILIPTSTTPTSTQRICPSGVSAPGGCYVPDEVPGTPTCFQVGFVSGVVDVQYQDMKAPVDDWHICASACADKPGCLSFGYDAQDTTSRYCALYASKLGWSFTRMSRGLTWSEMDCIKCVTCDEDAAPPIATETAVADA